MTCIHVYETRPEREAAASQIEMDAFAGWRHIYVPAGTAPKEFDDQRAPFARLVAELDGQVVGTVRWRVEEDRIHIRGLAVASKHRRCGIARALVGRCASIARQHDLRAVSAYTVTETGNLSIFQRFGFVVVRQQIATFAESPTGEPVTEAYLELPTR